MSQCTVVGVSAPQFIGFDHPRSCHVADSICYTTMHGDTPRHIVGSSSSKTSERQLREDRLLSSANSCAYQMRKYYCSAGNHRLQATYNKATCIQGNDDGLAMHLNSFHAEISYHNISDSVIITEFT